MRIRTLIAVALLAAHNAYAMPIFFEAVDLADSGTADRWQYNYTIDNTGGSTFDGFTIYFATGLFENLTLIGTDPAWDVIIDDPLSFADGIFDALYLLGSVQAGDIFTGFSVAFDYLGTGAPGEQFFELYTYDFLEDAITIVGEGNTTAAVTVPVPEPSTIALLAIGLLGLLVSRRRTAPLKI